MDQFKGIRALEEVGRWHIVELVYERESDGAEFYIKSDWDMFDLIEYWTKARRWVVPDIEFNLNTGDFSFDGVVEVIDHGFDRRSDDDL